MKKIQAFNIIKNKAGKDIRRLSLTLILIATPKNINIARPPEEISKIGELTIDRCNDIWEEIEPRGYFDFDEHNGTYGSNRKYQNLSITHDYVLDTQMGNLKKFYRWEIDYNANGYNIFCQRMRYISMVKPAR